VADNFWLHIRFFGHEEVVCPCGCGTGNISFEIMWLADRLRITYQEILSERYGDSDPRIRVTSGCRCPLHNAAIGGSPFSLHLAIPERLDCRALDLKPQNPRSHAMEALAAAAGTLNPPGLKIYPGWVHIDFRAGKWRG